MTRDRRKHPREPGLDGAGGRRRLQRGPAEAHFRRLGELAPAARAAPTDPCRFEVYRADEVSTSSIRFAGGDWHWRLCDEGGRALVDAGGYRDEHGCREAVALLKARAGGAAFTPGR